MPYLIDDRNLPRRNVYEKLEPVEHVAPVPPPRPTSLAEAVKPYLEAQARRNAAGYDAFADQDNAHEPEGFEVETPSGDVLYMLGRG